jgi:hypothetical protein
VAARALRIVWSDGASAKSRQAANREDLPTSGLQRLHVLNNRFINRPKLDNQNGYEIIQIGWSGEKARSAGSLIQGNTFENCDGEDEIITVKASDVVVRGNTFLGCQGALSLRHADRVLVQENVFDGNMNRQWGLGTTPETACVEKFVRELASRGRKVDLFMDFHGYCTPTRSTYLMTFGKELVGEACQQETMRLMAAIRPRLTGQWDPPRFWHKPVEPVSGIVSELRTLSCGWMKLEAQARLSLSVEINGEGQCTQDGYLAWGQAFAEGIADYYGLGGK